MSPHEPLPLPVLLSRVLGHVTAELESIGDDCARDSDVPSLAVWSNVVRCVADAGPVSMAEQELAQQARISSRLATAAVTGAARRGWIRAEALAGSKGRHLELTEAGRNATHIWPKRLAALTGSGSGPLRAALEDLVGHTPLELPHFPASYGAADPSAIGGPFVQRSASPDGVPPHGKDWRPVFRAEGDTVSSLPLTALLSQALMAFTIDYESRFPWPLASTSTVLCHLDAAPRPLADVPGDHGIMGNGKSLLERHLIAVVTRHAADGRTKMVALTGRGVTVVEHHPKRLAAVESEWRDRFGDALISDLRDALSGVASSALLEAYPDHVIAPLHHG